MAHPHPADHPGPMVFVDDLAHPVLSDGDRRHLERALRMRAGDPLTVADGAGRWSTAAFVPVLAPPLALTGPIHDAPPSANPLTVGFALVKTGKPEVIVQKLTELGIDRIVPFHAERSVVRWDNTKAAKAAVRLRTVAREAAMQSHRPRLPIIDEMADLRALVEVPGVAMADRDGEVLSLRHRFVLVGPEGGWAPQERGQPVTKVALGGNVLRAETAAITAGVLMAALRDGHLGRTT